MPKAFSSKPRQDTDKFRAADHFGTTVAITVQEYMPDFETVHGNRPTIKADITIVDGLFAGMDFGDVLIFDTAIVRELMDDDGSEPIVAKIVSYKARGKDCAKLEAPTAEMWGQAQALWVPASGDAPEATDETLPY